ncbi:hypothetical protein CW304_28830 [Bacillus sp. UFRGS-B20]|nr:hypothetical protein CW304_28830 [Bacillus sp. UFRGS-B20]
MLKRFLVSVLITWYLAIPVLPQRCSVNSLLLSFQLTQLTSPITLEVVPFVLLPMIAHRISSKNVGKRGNCGPRLPFSTPIRLKMVSHALFRIHILLGLVFLHLQSGTCYGAFLWHNCPILANVFRSIFSHFASHFPASPHYVRKRLQPGITSQPPLITKVSDIVFLHLFHGDLCQIYRILVLLLFSLGPALGAWSNRIESP